VDTRLLEKIYPAGVHYRTQTHAQPFRQHITRAIRISQQKLSHNYAHIQRHHLLWGTNQEVRRFSRKAQRLRLLVDRDLRGNLYRPWVPPPCTAIYVCKPWESTKISSPKTYQLTHVRGHIMRMHQMENQFCNPLYIRIAPVVEGGSQRPHVWLARSIQNWYRRTNGS